MLSGTVFGQLTPQRINYNNTKGVFFTDKQEEELLKLVVEHDYLAAALVRRDSTIKIMDTRIHDRDLLINKQQAEITSANKRTVDCLNTNAEINAQLVDTKETLKKTQGNLKSARKNNWILGGTSVSLFAMLIYSITH